MRVTDEMALAALDAQTAYWQDESLQSDCDNCKGTGTERIGYDGEQDWCHKCGGHRIDHQGTEEGAMRAALEAALSHAAGQEVDMPDLTGAELEASADRIRTNILPAVARSEGEES